MDLDHTPAGGVVADASGMLWFTADNTGLGRFNPNDDTVTLLAPQNDIRPTDAIITGPDGDLWTLSRGCPARVDPLQGTFEFVGAPCVGNGVDLTFAPDGHLWFIRGIPGRTTRLVDVDPGTGQAVEHLASGVIGGPGITTGPDGNLWMPGSSSRIAVAHLHGPSVRITKGQSSDFVHVGETIDYDITVTNTGETPLTGVTVTDPAAPVCDRNVGDLAIGQSLVIDCTYVARFDDGPRLYNTAWIDTNETPSHDSNTPVASVTADPRSAWSRPPTRAPWPSARTSTTTSQSRTPATSH